MKKINLLFTLFPLLVTSLSTYAGVTDDGVTAYRLSSDDVFVFFSDNPLDDPDSGVAPLGGGTMLGNSCNAGGGASVAGLVCIGISLETVADYSCSTINIAVKPSNTTWCLFSENPRTGGKAWAVKFVAGEIPTNDEASIVRCKETDRFDSDNGCIEGPSEIAITGGYINLETTEGSSPIATDCSLEHHTGRMAVDEVNELLYICTNSGWISK